MRTPSQAVSPALLLAAATGLTSLAGCRPLPASKPQAMWTAEESRGAIVFHQKCARCHHPNDTHPLNGPGLQALTKIQSMPSGAPPTDERLTAVILHGRNNMPATALSDNQLSDLLAYLHTI